MCEDVALENKHLSTDLKNEVDTWNLIFAINVLFHDCVKCA